MFENAEIEIPECRHGHSVQSNSTNCKTVLNWIEFFVLLHCSSSQLADHLRDYILYKVESSHQSWH